MFTCALLHTYEVSPDPRSIDDQFFRIFFFSYGIAACKTELRWIGDAFDDVFFSRAAIQLISECISRRKWVCVHLDWGNGASSSFTQCVCVCACVDDARKCTAFDMKWAGHSLGARQIATDEFSSYLYECPVRLSLTLCLPGFFIRSFLALIQS